MKKLLLTLILAAWFYFGKAQSPIITSFTPVNGAVGTLLTIKGTNLTSPIAFKVGGTIAIVVSTNDTQLVGLVMPGTVTGPVAITTAGGMVSSSNFTIDPTSYPKTQQGSKMVGTGSIGAAYQGWSVSLSSDGNTAIVGGISDNGYVGAVWIYTRSGGVWTQQGNKLVGTGFIGAARQGTSVALSSDGNTAIVGGSDDNNRTGAVWIYTRSGGVWTQQGSKLVGTGAIGINVYQGCSVSLSSDGNTAIVGGYGDYYLTGAAWIFTRSGGVWSQTGNKFVGIGAKGSAQQGQSVSLSPDGKTAIVGGGHDSSFAGAVWIYTSSGGVWTQQGNKLVGTGAVGTAQQGQSVSLSYDGNTAIVGGHYDNGNIGAVWIYSRSGVVWTQQGSKLVGAGFIGQTKQGYSVSLSSDGNTAIVGGNGDYGDTGASWIFTRFNGVWTQQGSKLNSTDGSYSNQGISVSLSFDGNTAIVGGPYDNNYTGAARIYTRSYGIWTQQGNKLVGKGAIGGEGQGGAVSLSSDGNTAIVGGYYDNNNTGAAWIYTRSGGIWMQQGGKLVGTGSIGSRAFQGSSVSLSADGNTAIVGGYGEGAVWIYTRSGGIWTQQGNKLVGTGAIGQAQQGLSASLSADGNTAIVGGYGDNNSTGAAWIFTRSGGVWTQQGSKLVGTGAIGGAQQGLRVSLSSDGNTAIVGGNYDNNFAGAAWIYTRSGGIWTQQGSKLVGAGAIGAAAQGESVSLSSDGNTAIVGGTDDNNLAGASWIFTRSGGVWTQQGKLVGSGASNDAFQGSSVSLSSDGNTAIAGGFNDNSSTGAIWIYTRSGGVWTQQGNKLIGTGAIGNSRQGESVCLSSDGNTAIVGGIGDNATGGAVWIYTTSSIVTVVSPVEGKQNFFTIYPNPNNGVCTVQSENEGVYSILNPLGQTVQTFKLNVANNYTQNIESLDNGIYFIVGDGSNGRIGKRVVVAK